MSKINQQSNYLTLISILNLINYLKMYTKEILLSRGYTWGEIIFVHEIGHYLIVEYKQSKDFCPEIQEDIILFHPYIKGIDTNTSSDSLDKALINAISINAGHWRAAEFIINMLSVKY